jgi:phosphate transport system substrate-binding protein
MRTRETRIATGCALVLCLAGMACESAGGGGLDADVPEVPGDVPADIPADLPADTPDVPADVQEVPPPPVTLETYPRIDGSTSNIPLARIIACELLGVPWKWDYQPTSPDSNSPEKTVFPAPTTPEQDTLAAGILERTVHTKTHQSYLNLIDGTKDLILVASAPSTDERAYAVEKGVTLAWTTLALDALVFLVNQENPVTGLTTAQIRGVFLGEVTNWKDVGGLDDAISPYIRPENSGSQQLMQELVMKESTMPAWPEDRVIQGMGGLVDQIKEDPDSLGYSVYYYVTYQYSIGGMRTVAVDGVAPAAATLADGTYPHVAPVYVVTRTDLAPTHLAAQMRDWLLAPGGQAVVAKSGYVPVLPGAAAR